jgi:glycosyltransferase involved in cell wall biosynthesis
MILVALRFAPTHRLALLAHRDAYLRACGPADVTWIVADEYAPFVPPGDRTILAGPSRPYSTLARRLVPQWITLDRLEREDLFERSDGREDVHAFVVTSHPAHPVVMRRIRQLFPNASVRYYLHEPTSWPEKVRRGVGVFMSTAVYATQCMELAQASLYYVASERELRASVGTYPIAGLAARGRIVQLVFPDLCRDSVADEPAGPPQVLMLGRADRHRCVDVFLESAAEALRRGSPWRFQILSASNPKIPRWATGLPNLRLTIGSRYSDEQMISAVRSSRFVFNVFRTRYTQSGVTPVALMCGTPVIADAQERERDLAAAGCLYFDETPSATQVVDALESCGPANRAALRWYYARTFDASALRIPDLVPDPDRRLGAA